MGRKRKAPHDPAKAMEASLQRQEREAEIARLKASGAEVTTDKRTGQILSARRSNVFTLLLARGTITQNHHNAAYDLANAWATWKGLDGKGDRFGAVVDGSNGSAELVTDRMIRAGKTVAWTLAQVDLLERTILTAFMVAAVEEDRAMQWRGIMERCGVFGRDRQTRAFVDACEALRAVVEGDRRAA